MVARVESSWLGVSGRADLVVTYPSGGVDYDVSVSSAHQDFGTFAVGVGAAIQAVLTAALGPGAYCTGGTAGANLRATLVFPANNVDLLIRNPLQTFGGYLPTYTNIDSLDAAEFAPSKFWSVAALPEPDPYFQLDRDGAAANSGRLVGYCRDVVPIQPLRLRFDNTTGHDWTALQSWLAYACQGIPFVLYRSLDVGSYAVLSGAVNGDGYSYGVLTAASADVARQLLDNRFDFQGFVDLEMRLKSAY